MTPRVVDLGKYAGEIGILAGRTRGMTVRREEQLDDLDRDGGLVLVLISDSVSTITSSFSLGMFERSILKLGEAEFRRRYAFEGRDSEKMKDEVIRKALLMNAPLRPKRKIA